MPAILRIAGLAALGEVGDPDFARVAEQKTKRRPGTSTSPTTLAAPSPGAGCRRPAPGCRRRRPGRRPARSSRPRPAGRRRRWRRRWRCRPGRRARRSTAAQQVDLGQPAVAPEHIGEALVAARRPPRHARGRRGPSTRPSAACGRAVDDQHASRSPARRPRRDRRSPRIRRAGRGTGSSEERPAAATGGAIIASSLLQ